MPLQWLRKLAPLILIVFIFSGGSHVSAHDMYLGGSKWAIGKDRILSTIELDPALFQEIRGIKGLKYDLDNLTNEQLYEIETKIIQPYINEKLSVSVNNRSYPIKVEKIEREGTFWKIWLKMSEVGLNWQENKVKIEYRLLFEETNNQHVNLGYIYFTDADDESVQEVFNYNQPDLQYTLDSRNTVWNFSDKTAALLSDISTFLLLGMKHILAGYAGFDHIAFLIALLVIGLSTRGALTIFASYTVSYSITLLLAAMQVVTLNSRYVESVIAFSICYIALENLLAKQINYRWLVTFMFGLAHGFGFANDLQGFIAGKSNLVHSVVSFHVGVELGQLMIFLIILLLIYLIKKKLPMRKVTAVTSVFIFIAGFIWFVDRVFNLHLVPF
ncbi:hypothetical protein FHS16_003710 [Paenibacillus endophyticus]|uniref:HupE/UreJ family protein n=1 Tax=Paenibacillus endophyticus TaxID=1294268 RepID=A0A7W5C9K8_9BACL|nr:HupE/UreJ family protein [Paenibacillus endophyticus]MBB3153635.1 hypothetical protein [Paenibacillus endophyticus]